MDQATTKKRGRKPLPDAELRVFRVAAWLTTEEAKELDAMRGKKARGEWLREAAFGAAVVVPPAINGKVWADLGHGLSNLNQIARKLNGGRSVDHAELEAEIVEVRGKLLGLIQ